MNISDMHVWFRQYAQQMGMQNVRAILPEQIDILINTSITDTVNQIIRENVGITNDRVITDNSKIGQINALKHLYKVEEISFVTPYSKLVFDQVALEDDNLEPVVGEPNYSKIKLTVFNEAYVFDYNGEYLSKETKENIKEYYETKGIHIAELNIDLGPQGGVPRQDAPIVISANIGAFDFDGVSVSSSNTKFVFVDDNGDTLAQYENNDVEVITSIEYNFDFEQKNHYNGLVTLKRGLQDYLFLVDFSIDYVDASIGIGKDINYLNNFKTNLFPIRLIDDAYLADTLNDFVLKPRLRSPIAIIVNNNLQIYLGKLNGNTTTGYFLDNNLVPDVIRVAYIAKPAIVKYSEDINGQNVDCDLPDYMHVDILKHAVDLYRAAISGGIAASQASEQAQNRENVRNNYRDEGYQ